MKVKQIKETCAERFGDNLVVLNLNTHRSCIFNGSALLIWNFCKKPRSLNQICRLINRTYQVNLSQAKRNVKKLINQLEERHLVVCR